MASRHIKQLDATGGSADLDKPTTLLAFAKRFPDDKACEAYLFNLRWPDGFVCPKCDSRKAWRMNAAHLSMKCDSDHITSVTAGTAMHRTKLPFTHWFYAAYLVSTLTPGISAVQLQKQLGISRYETAFQLLHKLRSGLVASGRDKLRAGAPLFEGDEPPIAVEVDEFFVGGVEEGHPGRGTDEKALVICAVEVVAWDEIDKKDPNAAVQRKRAGRVRLNVIPNASAEVLLPWVQANVAAGSLIQTDGWAGYNGLGKLGYTHERVVQSHKGMKTGQYLPLVHLIISNIKAWLLGTFHGAVSRKHIPAYLNEYVFRFNRRFWRGPAFVRALGLLTSATDRPEYETLYAVGTDNTEAWAHPNPRRVATIDVIEAIYADVCDAADATLRSWLEDNTMSVQKIIKRTIETS